MHGIRRPLQQLQPCIRLSFESPVNLHVEDRNLPGVSEKMAWYKVDHS